MISTALASDFQSTVCKAVVVYMDPPDGLGAGISRGTSWNV